MVSCTTENRVGLFVVKIFFNAKCSVTENKSYENILIMAIMFLEGKPELNQSPLFSQYYFVNKQSLFTMSITGFGLLTKESSG
jgi:hypothetical protein